MNPPSIILGGVHGKACWLIAYIILCNKITQSALCILHHTCNVILSSINNNNNNNNNTLFQTIVHMDNKKRK